MKSTTLVFALAALTQFAGTVAAQRGCFPVNDPPVPPGGGDPIFERPPGGRRPPPPNPIPESRPEPEPEPRTTPTRITPRTTPRLNAGSRGIGRSTPRPSRKKAAAAWTRHLAIPWMPAFPGTEDQGGYGRSVDDIHHSLKTPTDRGGWEREPGPSLVLVYDPQKPGQKRAVNDLNKNIRFAAAARLFNTFKVDSRGLVRSGRDVRLMVFDHQARLTGEVRGRNLGQALKLMAKVYDQASGKSFTRVLPKVVHNAKGAGLCEARIQHLERNIVCSHCGDTHRDVPQKIEASRKQKSQFEEAIRSFRVTPKN